MVLYEAVNFFLVPALINRQSQLSYLIFSPKSQFPQLRICRGIILLTHGKEYIN